MNRHAGRPIPATTRRPEWFAFGSGIFGPSDGVWTPAHDVAVTVWGAALYAVRVVTANLLRDGTPATQMSAVRLAQARVRRAAAEDLWWVRNRDDWLRDGGDDARQRPATLAEWATKWSGLARLRRRSDCPAGYDLRPGTPLVSGWPRGQE